MRKAIKSILITFSMLMIMGISFCVIYTSPREEAYADINGVSSNNYILVGYNGYQPDHYFFDKFNNSTLSKATTKASPKDYIDSRGQRTRERYVVTAYYTAINFNSAKSSGYVDLYLTADMQEFAANGVLYAKFNVGVLSLNSDEMSKVNFLLSYGDTTVTKQSTKVDDGGDVYEPEYIDSDYIKITDISKPIRFSFESKEASTFFKSPSFMLFEPSIRLRTAFDSLSMDGEGQENVVYPGDKITLSATTPVLTTTASSDLAKLTRSIHNVTYDIIYGRGYIKSIIGNNIYVSDYISSDSYIKVRAKCRNDSYSDQYIYSEVVTYKISAEPYIVSVETDFENPGKITGQGNYYKGNTVSLIASANSGYKFKGWEKDGELVSTSRNYSYRLEGGEKIKALYTRDVKINSVVVSDKYYDGTDVATVIGYDIQGKEPSHDLSVENVQVKYSQSKVGQNIILNIYQNEPVLVGKDAHLYNLVVAYVPTCTGNILPRPVTVRVDECSKSYGDGYENITFTTDVVDGVANSGIVAGESLAGTLSRVAGENVGQYDITIGSLVESNPNYDITFVSNKFTILRRDISVADVSVADRNYDGTKAVVIQASLSNIIANDDIRVEITGEYSTSAAGSSIEVVNVVTTLIGEDRDNYNLLDYTQAITGNILKRPVVVRAESKTVVYGDAEPEFTYSVEGLVSGETLAGSLAREEGTAVGTYNISIGNMAEVNPNYLIDYTGADYIIKRKNITLTPDELSKTYGDPDCTLTYTVQGLVGDDSLQGSLARATGDDCGEYAINIGNIYDPNYNIELISKTFKITPRHINLEINVIDREYDGTAIASYTYEFTNVAYGDELEFSADIRFVDGDGNESVDVGEKHVSLSNFNISGAKIDNYEITNNANTIVKTISRRRVYVDVDNYEKVYGEQDPDFDIRITNVVSGESLSGTPMRNPGEDVGRYFIYLNDMNNDNNPNYNIIYRLEGSLTIVKREVVLAIESKEKYYSEQDPEINYIISSQFADGEIFDDVVTGYAVRTSGENVGVYKYSIGTLAVGSNYRLEFVDTGALRILKKPVSIIANSKSKIYGENEVTLDYEVEGLIDNVPLMNFSLTRARGESCGEYAIMYTSLDDPRYDITYTGATYTIMPRQLKVKADDKYMVYGGVEPQFTCSIVEGILVNNDTIYNIQEGSMTREEGGNAGEYTISRGDYSLGINYELEFETGTLSIVKRNIEISANNLSKYYGDVDPYLSYIIKSGTIVAGDSLSGTLARVEGETVGEYDITIGTLAISDNYNIIFTPASLTIDRRPITILADEITKVYGESDPELTYTMLGDLVYGDELQGGLTREKPTTVSSPYLYENSGKYSITSTLNNNSYAITYIPNNFIIEQRVIEIAADSKSKVYGQPDEELSYVVLSGEILDGDEIDGSLYRVPGETVGVYDIRSSLTLGRNYKIVFSKGMYTITPISLVLRAPNYEKVYGGIDPIFEYEIVEGILMPDDVLAGSISREEGETVGSYKLISTINNVNYDVTLIDAYMTITHKNAYLECGIQDKVYDGSNLAHIKTPMIKGLIDEDIELEYDKDNCAYFVSIDPGMGVGVVLHDIKLKGDAADNYNLVLPQGLTANITLNAVTDENVSITTSSNTSLLAGTELVVSRASVKAADIGVSNRQVITSYEVKLEQDGEDADIDGTITLEINIPKKYTKRNNIYVYRANEDGTYTHVSSTVVGNTVLVNTDELGTYVVAADNEIWIDVGAYISIGVLVIIGAYVIWRLTKKRNAKKTDTKEN